MKIGEKLKALRQEKGLSLEQLAGRVNLTRGFLSQVEKEKTSPSLSSLVKILGALDVRLADFFHCVEQRSGAVLRKDERRYYTDEGKARVASLAAGFPNPTFEPFYAEFEPGLAHEHLSGQGQIFAFVLQGALEIIIDDEAYVLEAGDCLYFDGRRPHAIRGGPGGRAAALFVTDKSIVTFL